MSEQLQLLFPSALAAVAAAMVEGEKNHGSDDWRNRPPSFHIQRARAHLDALDAGDRTEDHLAHAATRLLMVLELEMGR